MTKEREKEAATALELDVRKATGEMGPLYVGVAKLAEEVGMLLKLVSQMHRTGERALGSYFDSELQDLTYQVELLCLRRGKTLKVVLQQGRERFLDRVKLGEKG